MSERTVIVRLSVTDQYSANLRNYNTQVSNAATNTNNAGNAMGTANTNASSLAGTLRTVVTAAMVTQVGNYVTQMVSVGNEANQTQERFAALTKSMGGYDDLMARLRKATLNVTDDMNLQQGAMLLVQTAGITTADELERMMNIIALSKKPSEDMTAAMNNFGLMLANNSILRLDSFGISASAVRARIIELQASGEAVDRSQAFRMAVMEEAEKNILRLGPAADAAGTALARLQVKATNVFQDISQATAEGAQGFALGLEYLLGMTPEQQAASQRQVEDTAITLALDYQTAFDAAMSGAGGGINENVIGNFVKKSLELAATDPSLMGDVDGFMARIFQDLGLAVGDTAPFREILEQTLQIQASNQSQRDVAKEIANEQQRILDIETARATNTRIVLGFTDQMADLNERNSRYAIEQYQIEQNIAANRAQMIGAMGASETDAMSVFSGGSFATQEQADQVRAIADESERIIDNMKHMNETEGTKDMFSYEQMEAAKQTADNVGKMADEAERAAAAFENIKLSELFGQTSGGTLQEIGDAVVAQMEAAGATADQIAATQQQFGLASGAETQTSMLFDEQIAPLLATIATQAGPELATQIASQLDQTLKDAVLAGVDVNSPEFANSLSSALSSPEGAEAFNSTDFLADFSAAQEFIDPIKESVTQISEDFANASSSLEAAKGFLQDLGGKITTVRIQTEWVNKDSLLQTLLDGLQRAIQSNGGAVPGASSGATLSAAV